MYVYTVYNYVCMHMFVSSDKKDKSKDKTVSGNAQYYEIIPEMQYCELGDDDAGYAVPMTTRVNTVLTESLESTPNPSFKAAFSDQTKRVGTGNTLQHPCDLSSSKMPNLVKNLQSDMQGSHEPDKLNTLKKLNADLNANPILITETISESDEYDILPMPLPRRKKTGGQKNTC